MFTMTQRLGTLDPKAKLATRTAKDGEEYSQLVFEVCDLEVTDTEVNAIFSSPRAYAVLKALHAEIKGIKAIELDDKIEGATVVVRLAAVSAQNGPEFTFNGCTVSKLRLEHLESDAVKASFRVTAKPALNAQFGELVAKFGHTAMVELRADSPLAQAELPLNGVGANERITSSIGTPKEERQKARRRDSRMREEFDNPEMSNTGRQIQATAAKAERKKRRDAPAELN